MAGRPRKPGAQRVAETEARKRAAGLAKIPVWVPNTDDAKAAIRDLAKRLIEEFRH